MKNGKSKKCTIDGKQYLAMLDLESFVNQLRVWRISRGKTKKDFFAELGLSMYVDQQWKRGTVPSADSIFLIKFATDNKVDFANFIKFKRIYDNN